ncbi:hypothetical protein AVEN_237814-1 [Araneus ventricosus]|uniref:Uncharacterized protein n=1 Tax=Araneus ventricosus TaxID=182803 RepID=A0A4Y2UHH3_ARAVE|nr:hypothetical protein AVEN_237814-1 [Araneus ventricosus]
MDFLSSVHPHKMKTQKVISEVLDGHLQSHTICTFCIRKLIFLLTPDSVYTAHRPVMMTEGTEHNTENALASTSMSMLQYISSGMDCRLDVVFATKDSHRAIIT